MRLPLIAGIVGCSLATAAACASFDDAKAVGPDGGVSPDGSALSDATADASSPSSPSATYRAAILADDPVVYWRMGRVETLNLVPDETGKENMLVLAGGFAIDPAGLFADEPAIAFDGINGYAEAAVSTPLEFNGRAPFTVECWARYDGRLDIPTSYFEHVFAFVAGVSGGEAQNGYVLYLTNATPPYLAAFRDSPDAAAKQQQFPLAPKGAWAHYAYVYDGAQIRAFSNGQPQGLGVSTDAELAPRPTVRFTVAKGSNEARNFHGAIDELAVYAKALDAATIAKHHALGRGQ